MTKHDTRDTIYDENAKAVKSFTDLRAWREAHKFAVSIYKATKTFPSEEIFGLTTQLRRAAVSIGSNVAEGFGRDTWQEKLRFYFIARGSLTEVQSQLLVARDVGYLKSDTFDSLANQAIGCHKTLSGLIKKTQEIQKV